MAETQLRQSQASLDVARSRLSYTTISAPRDGVLIARNVEKGYVVQPGGILMVLSPSGSTQLVVQIDEKNLGLIAIGQKAIASADAFPKATFAAEVAYINPGIDLQRASVQVKLRVPEPPTYLQQDMTVSVDIETARHRNVTVAPTTSVRALNGERPWVLKVKEGRAHRQEIVIGLVSGGQAEVLNGLEPGDKILPASSPIEDGKRVRLVPTRSSSR
jgi:HlyD family secretion protein